MRTSPIPAWYALYLGSFSSFPAYIHVSNWGTKLSKAPANLKALPISRDSLQLSASILAQNLKSITDHMRTHSDLFEKIVVYPSTNFPGRTQEVLLGQLLRKKLEPGVERWVEEGRATALQTGSGLAETDGGLEEKWKAAKDFIGERVARAAVTHRRDEYTAEEREMGIEHVNTGLQRPMKMSGDNDDSDSDEDEDEDQEMEDVGVVEVKDGSGLALGLSVEEKKVQGKVRSLDEIVRFMTTGLTPEDEIQTGGMAYRR